MIMRRIGSAHLLGAVALFVALGGTAMANDSVRAFITGADVRDGSLTGRDVRNRSLTAADLAPGVLRTGPAGPQGPAGPDLAGATHVRVRGDRTPAENGAALRAALASITDASATRPYVIQLAPGIYELGRATLAMKPDVSIAGAGAATTRITGDQGQATLGEALVLGADRTLLRDVTVANRGEEAGHFHTAMAVRGGAAMRIEDAVVEGGGSPEPGGNGGAASPTRRIVVAVYVAGGSDVRIRGSELVAGSQLPAFALYLQDDGSTAVVENSALVSSNRAVAGVNGGTATVGASRVEGGGVGPVTCAASYDGGFAEVDAGCN